MNCIIVDDDEFAQMMIKKCVERTDALNLLSICSNAFDALNFLKENPADLIFLDIEMPEMNGIEFIQSLANVPQIILVSSKDVYALEAFEYDVVDYILKPVEYPRFIKAVEKAQRMNENVQLPEPTSDHLFIKKDSKLIRLELKDILFIEALADYVNIHTEDNRYTVLSTMKAMESKLPKQAFARTHRSYIIRLDKIISIEENVVTVKEKSIPISRSYKENIMKRLNFL